MIHVLAEGDMRLSSRLLVAPGARARVASFERADLLLAPDIGHVRIDARGYTGRTWIRGQLADDVLYGGEGPDEIDASSGDDLVYGGSGNDTIDGSRGLDTCDGGSGDDVLHHCER